MSAALTLYAFCLSVYCMWHSGRHYRQTKDKGTLAFFSVFCILAAASLSLLIFGFR